MGTGNILIDRQANFTNFIQHKISSKKRVQANPTAETTTDKVEEQFEEDRHNIKEHYMIHPNIEQIKKKDWKSKIMLLMMQR